MADIKDVYDRLWEKFSVEDLGWLTHTLNKQFVRTRFEAVTPKKVIFNPPATIILWNDGSKSVVKCQDGEPFDAEKGFVLAYLKKLLGNDNTFNKMIHKWVSDNG